MHRRGITRATLAATAVLAMGGLGLIACSSDGDGELVEGVTETVNGIDNSFTPAELTVQPGTEIVFANRGRNDHNVIPADEGEDWEIAQEDFTPGTEAEPIRFTEPGTYGFYCSIHGTATVGMIGTITVEG